MCWSTGATRLNGEGGPLSRVGDGICGSVELDGGHDRDRTCDPYHVKVVLSRRHQR
jgi:hypothetical protein